MFKTVLVTGGAGFIGSHLCDRLIARGDRVICLDNFDDFYDERIKRENIAQLRDAPRFVLVDGDFRDPMILEDIFAAYSVDVVAHLGGRGGVRPSVEKPHLYLDLNTRGTLVLLDAMRANGVAHLVFASTSSIYGMRYFETPFREGETRSDTPESPYAASKKAAELLIHTYHRLYGLHAYCLRFFTAIGERQRPDMALAKFTKAILTGEPVTIYGDGSAKRDFTYVGDTVSAVVAAVDNVLGYEIINVGGGHCITVKQMVSAIEVAAGRRAITAFVEDMPGDLHFTLADKNKAEALLDFFPAHSAQYGIEQYVKWAAPRIESHAAII